MKIFEITMLEQTNLSSCVNAVLEKIDYISDYSCSETFVYNIKLALWEVFTNFICHGNECSRCNIQVRIDETETEIALTITSIGNQFDWEKYKGMDCPDNDQVGGRGLYILQHICDHLSYENMGQVIKMRFDKERKYTNVN
ncbi:ATP-binding protein [Cytobacillus sp. FJAT-54145]|uniref:ATP-binding protein n=1 Tax=Cytobacillus spartinae TaxID=3299023 RepID=A0ABW6KFS3_9BACI